MSDMTITFLGTGTSHGVPVIGCRCPVCRSGDPRDRRTRSSIHVATPECHFVVDTGADFRAQCLREGISRLDAVVYTHSHSDHIMGFDDLRRFCEVRGGGIPIFASPATMADLRRVFAFAFDGENRWPGYVIPEPREIEGPFQLGETELVPLPVPHGRSTVFGYLLGRAGRKCIAYLSDCKEVPEPAIGRIAGVRHLVIDALRFKTHPTHLSIPEALAVAARVGAGQTWFTHLCHEVAHAAAERDLPPGVQIAYDGLKITA